MSLQRVGGPSDHGIDLQGWWWLPTLNASHATHEHTHHRRMRVLAQCKAEKKKMGPAYLRELEGVMHRYVVGAVDQDLHPAPASSPLLSAYPIVGLFLSQSPFTKQALLRAHSSPLPLCLLHLPEALPDPENPEAEDDDDHPDGLGSILFNHALTNGVLRGEVEARWERPSTGTASGRPGLWWNGERIQAWIPEVDERDSDGADIASHAAVEEEGEVR